MNIDKTMMILSAVVIIVVAITATIFFLGAPSTTIPGDESVPEEQPRGCTKELKICPDGTGVGRSGPNCEFAECPVMNSETNDQSTTTSETPTANDQVFCTQDVKECPDGTYVSRKPPTCEFETCPAPIACTMEAKLCPDGETYVGRTGPNCEFEACPEA